MTLTAQAGKPDCQEHGPATDDATTPPLKICALRSVDPPLERVRPEAEDSQLRQHFQMLPGRNMLQCNVVADSTSKEHVVEWRWTDNVDPDSPAAEELRSETGRGVETADGKFVRGLKLGDVVTVWAKSRFPGWVNHVESVKVDVFWAI
jgi:hypothetical protein